MRIALAVTPPLARDAATVIGAARERGVEVELWPMMTDVEGRWLSESNAAGFAAYVRRLVERLQAEGCAPRTVVLDLEPPIDVLRAIVRRGLRAWPRALRPAPARTRAAARDGIAALLSELRARNIESVAAVAPLVVADGAGAGWQRMLGTPIEGLAFDRVSAMMYTSVVTGYARGAVRRADARALLAEVCTGAVAKWGRARASVSVGAIGAGALGDESSYRDAGELAEDVAIARASGIEDVYAFELGGALRRPPLERWLDAMDAQAAQPPPRLTLRSAALSWSTRGIARALDAEAAIRAMLRPR